MPIAWLSLAAALFDMRTILEVAKKDTASRSIAWSGLLEMCSTDHNCNSIDKGESEMKGRYEIHHEGKSLAFGNDCACGEFLQIWDTTKYRMPDENNILVDEDRFTGLTKEKMEELIAAHGFSMAELEERWQREGGLI